MAKSYLEQTKEFHKFYQTEALPLLIGYENYRQETYNKLKRYKIGLKISYTISVLSFISCWLFLDIFPVWVTIFVASVILFITTLAFHVNVYQKKELAERKNFSRIIKLKCLEKLIKLFGNITISGKYRDKSYQEVKPEINNTLEQSARITELEAQGATPEQMVACMHHIEPPQNWHSPEELWLSGLFPDFNKKEVDDEFWGSYNGVNFKISELSLNVTKTRIYTGPSPWYSYIGGSIFKGIVLSFNINKRIDNRIILSGKGDNISNDSWKQYAYLLALPFISGFLRTENLVFRIILIIVYITMFIWLKRTIGSRSALKKIKPKDAKLNKKFNIYAEEPADIENLLTPNFIKKFQNLKTAFDTKKIKCSFSGCNLMFAIQTNKNLFEICTLDKSIKDPKSINDFYNELTSILEIIEDFKAAL